MCSTVQCSVVQCIADQGTISRWSRCRGSSISCDCLPGDWKECTEQWRGLEGGDSRIYLAAQCPVGDRQYWRVGERVSKRKSVFLYALFVSIYEEKEGISSNNASLVYFLSTLKLDNTLLMWNFYLFTLSYFIQEHWKSLETNQMSADTTDSPEVSSDLPENGVTYLI